MIIEIEHARIMNISPDQPIQNENVDDVDDKNDKNDDDTANPQTSSLQLQPLCSDVEAECSGGRRLTLGALQILILLNFQIILRNFY